MNQSWNAILPLSMYCAGVALWVCCKKFKLNVTEEECSSSSHFDGASGKGTLSSLIGNTPLVKLEKLSKVIGCDIFVKVFTYIHPIVFCVIITNHF